MAPVTVADDVLSAQPSPVRELDLELLAEHDIQEWVIDHWQSDVRFLVSPDGPHPASATGAEALTEARLDTVAIGVRAAAKRFWLVDESGRELPDMSATYLSDLRTPDQVVGPLRSGSGIVVATGTKDGVTVPMGEALVNVLREELERLDVAAHIACLPNDIDLDDLTPYDDTAPPEPSARSHAQPEDKFWYVTRPVTRTAASGIRRFDRYFLHPDFTWSQDHENGVSFAQADRAQVFRLVEKLRATADSEDGEVTALLLPATSAEPHPLPPEEISGRG
jgi:hypothetical protein